MGHSEIRKKEVSEMEPGFLAHVVLNNSMLKIKQYLVRHRGKAYLTNKVGCMIKKKNHSFYKERFQIVNKLHFNIHLT